jgi:hypothetical protein
MVCRLGSWAWADCVTADSGGAAEQTLGPAAPNKGHGHDGEATGSQ